MNLEALRARLTGIVAKLEEYKSLEKYSDEQVEAINALSEEFEATKKQIEAAEKIAAMSVEATVSVRKVAPLESKVVVGVDRKTLDPKGGFKAQGEFFRAVAMAAKGEVDNRLRIQAGAQEKIGEDGGFLIPVDFRQEIQKKVMGDESLLPKTRQFQTSSNTLTLPTNETAPWDGTGIQAYWENEATEFTATKAKFGDTTLRLHKLTAMVRVTEELLEDAPALESWIKGEAPAAMMHKINSAIIAGSGAGQPLGYMNSGFKYKVAKESAQTADTVNFSNVNKMLGRILPNSFPNSVWLLNPALLEQIRAMKFDLTSSTPIPVYMPPSGISGSPYGTLYGRPVLPMMGGVKAVGDEGDISLVDLSYYHTAIKTAGIQADISTHVYFASHESAFRFVMRVAGACPFKAPVSVENGSYDMSAFITLEAR